MLDLGGVDGAPHVRVTHEPNGHTHSISDGCGRNPTQEHGLYDGGSEFATLIDLANHSELSFDSDRDRVVDWLSRAENGLDSFRDSAIGGSDCGKHFLLSIPHHMAGRTVSIPRKRDSENRNLEARIKVLKTRVVKRTRTGYTSSI